MCNDEISALKCIEKFVKDIFKVELNQNNIEILYALKTFDFFNLVKGKSGQEIYSFDPDNLSVTNAVYYLTLKDNIPDLTMNKIGHEYRGDTINTFNTLFGKSKLLENNIKDPELHEMVNFFIKKYLTTGNFYLLPNKAPEGYSTLNCVRGNFNELRDYFSPFLERLKSALDDTNSTDNIFLVLIEENKNYFEKIGFDKFIEINYLSPFINSDGTVKKLQEEKYTYNNENDNGYKEFCINFIKQSIFIIDYRSECVISKLKDVVLKLYKES